MARLFRLEGLNLMMLQAIAQSKDHYLRIKDLADKLAKSQQLISKKAILLEKKGYVKRIARGMLTELWLTELGLEVSARLPTDKVVSFGDKVETEPTLRPHAFEAKFELKDKLASDAPSKLLLAEGLFSKPLSLKNQEGAYFAGEYSGLLTRSSLIVYSPTLELPQDANISLVAKDMALGLCRMALQLEARLGVKLARKARGILQAEVIKHEIAFKNHQIAKDAKENENKIYGYDPETQELIVISDFSHGFPEFEAVNRKTCLYNAEEIQKASEWMASGGMRNWVEREELSRNEDRELLHETISQLNYFAKTFVQHEEAYKQNIETNKVTQRAIEKLNIVLDKLNRKLSQRRLFDD